VNPSRGATSQRTVLNLVAQLFDGGGSLGKAANTIHERNNSLIISELFHQQSADNSNNSPCNFETSKRFSWESFFFFWAFSLKIIPITANDEMHI
jgi:hypothetical protein